MAEKGFPEIQWRDGSFAYRILPSGVVQRGKYTPGITTWDGGYLGDMDIVRLLAETIERLARSKVIVCELEEDI